MRSTLYVSQKGSTLAVRKLARTCPGLVPQDLPLPAEVYVHVLSDLVYFQVKK